MNIMKKYRAELVMSMMILLFQQLTQINAIMFYMLVLFKTNSFGNHAPLLSSVIIGLVNLITTFLSVFTIDRRRKRQLNLSTVKTKRNVVMQLTSPVMTDDKRDVWSLKPMFLHGFSTTLEASIAATKSVYAWSMSEVLCITVVVNKGVGVVGEEERAEGDDMVQEGGKAKADAPPLAGLDLRCGVVDEVGGEDADDDHQLEADVEHLSELHQPSRRGKVAQIDW
ncbi:Sugar transport protein 10 [Acorus calamus]|uniref:Sugar transport protein 10 n=1 Tax=Acorus calamus TaxID=4465 RepID=A0AAV9ERR1_ACOCL|nr:Sugar transport protein 10 [Acorus calamus]